MVSLAICIIGDGGSIRAVLSRPQGYTQEEAETAAGDLEWMPCPPDTDPTAHMVSNGEIVARPPQPVDIAALMERRRMIALERLDAIASRIERREVENGGRALTYMQKEREARAVMALVDPAQADPEEYPMVSADIAAGDAANMREASERIIAAVQRLTAIAAPLETWRRSRKIAINAATTPEEIEAILADTSLASLKAALG
jgi:hypothetical protein